MAKNNSIVISDAAQAVIANLQNVKGGDLPIYRAVLRSLRNLALFRGDEIGMSDTESIRTVRVLESLIGDLEKIAGPEAARNEMLSRVAESFNESAGHVESILSDVAAMGAKLREASANLNSALACLDEAEGYADEAGLTGLSREIRNCTSNIEMEVEMFNFVLNEIPDGEELDLTDERQGLDFLAQAVIRLERVKDRVFDAGVLLDINAKVDPIMETISGVSERLGKLISYETAKNVADPAEVGTKDN